METFEVETDRPVCSELQYSAMALGGLGQEVLGPAARLWVPHSGIENRALALLCRLGSAGRFRKSGSGVTVWKSEAFTSQPPGAEP